VPIAVVLEYVHAEQLILFVVAAIALIPLAKLIGDSTEHLASHYGATLGSLLNVTFGNAAEIIIARGDSRKYSSDLWYKYLGRWIQV
jgi:Ca2+:H+ antiporter